MSANEKRVDEVSQASVMNRRGEERLVCEKWRQEVSRKSGTCRQSREGSTLRRGLTVMDEESEAGVVDIQSQHE